MSFHLSSAADPGILVFSARHVSVLPWSRCVGRNCSTERVKFPFDRICGMNYWLVAEDSRNVDCTACKYEGLFLTKCVYIEEKIIMNEIKRRTLESVFPMNLLFLYHVTTAAGREPALSHSTR